MRLPNSYSKCMPGDENNNEIIKGQRYMFYDYRLTFLLQKPCYIKSLKLINLNSNS